jgi:hypothetical protein
MEVDIKKHLEQNLTNLLDSLYRKKKYIKDKIHEFNGLKRGTEALSFFMKPLRTNDPKNKYP